MSLQKLDVFAVRNIQATSIEPAPILNLITGANGSGKSSLLEAIFILGRARSFRTTHTRQAIAFNQPQLIVAGQCRMLHQAVNQIGIQIDHKQLEIHINRENKQKADLAYALPVQLIHPKSYRLLDGGPQLRREFLDWGIFNQHKSFLSNWRKFNKALQQRNSLLKDKQFSLLSAWDKELVEYGEVVNNFRVEYVKRLEPVFMEMASHFLGTDQLQLKFYPGWDSNHSLLDVLQMQKEKDQRYGFTQNGPHRAEFLTYFENRLVKDYLSRGQLKLLVLALLLSQVKILNQDQQNSCCILIDDLTAELDTLNRSKLLKYLLELGCQVFMTATDLSDFGDLGEIKNYKMFHVEQGCVKQY